MDESKEMYVERLKQLRRVIEAVPEDRLDMSVWCNPYHACGTSYCAGGWAAVDPWFRENTEIGSIFVVDEQNRVEHVPDGRTFEKLASLFDIDEDDADELFDGPDDVTKRDVINNIDRLIRGEHVLSYDHEDFDGDLETC